MGATRQSPEVFGAFCLRMPLPQAPENQVAIVPVCRSLNQAFVKSGSVLTSFLLIKSCQYDATCRACGLFIETFQDWPLVVNNWPPFCQMYPVNCPGCLGGKSVM